MESGKLGLVIVSIMAIFAIFGGALVMMHNDVSGNILSGRAVAPETSAGGLYGQTYAIDSNGNKISAIYAEESLNCKWTTWKNRDTQGGVGDFETLSGITDSDICVSPAAVECQTASGADYTTTRQNVTCNTKEGAYCYNSRNSATCQDYKVRFCCPQTTPIYVPFNIGISEIGPASDTVIAVDVAAQLFNKNLISNRVGIAKLFNELDVFQLDKQITLLIYNGKAIILVGEKTPVSYSAFVSELSKILTSKGISFRTISISQMPSSNLIDLFETNSICTDSDGSMNVYDSSSFYIKGTTKYAGETHVDECEKDPYGNVFLREWHCVSGNGQMFIKGELETCPNGCVDGACMAEVAVKCTDSDNTSDITGVYLSPENMAANKYPFVFVKGKATGIYVSSTYNVIYGTEPNPTFAKPSPYDYSLYYDHCASATQLNEAYCTKDGKLAASGVTCPNGCKDGACVITNISTCSDSDGGTNYYVKGTITGNLASGDIRSDMCINSVTLRELFCNSNNIGWPALYDCPNGCKDGVCLKDNITQITLKLNEQKSVTFNGVTISLKLVFLDDTSGAYGVEANGRWTYVYDLTLEMPIADYTSIKGISYTKIHSGTQSITVQLLKNNYILTNNCVDTDNGRTFTKYGEVTYAGQKYKDFCSGSQVFEYVCENEFHSEHNIAMAGLWQDCPNGCVDGACVQATTNTSCTIGEIYLEKGENTVVTYYNGKEFRIEIKSVDLVSGFNTVTLLVNNIASPQLTEGSTAVVNGVNIAVGQIFINDVGTYSESVDFFVAPNPCAAFDSAYVRTPGCGDGVVNLKLGEECEFEQFDGEEYYGGGMPEDKSCGTYGFNRGSLTCNSKCKITNTSCFNVTGSVCGDEIVDLGEDCDSSNLGFSGRLTVDLSTVPGEDRNATVVFNVDFNQEHYLIELLGANTESETIILRFDGEVKTFGEFEVKNMKGFNIYVGDIKVVSSTSPAAVRAIVEIRQGEVDECSDLGSELNGTISCNAECEYIGCSNLSVSLPNYDEFTLRLQQITAGDYYESIIVFEDLTNNKQYRVEGSDFINVGDKMTLTINGVEHTITLADATKYYEKIYFDDMGPFTEDDVFVVKSSNGHLGDYPLPFMTSDGYPNTLFIVGKNAAVEDVIGVTDIVASLQRYAGENPLPMGLVKFDVDVSENDLYNRNVIIVGGICANTATAAMYGNPLDCTAYDSPGVGHIKLIRNKNSDKVVLLVHGYSSLDTTMATRVLANWENFKDAFDSSDSLCITGTLSSINVQSC